MDKDKLFVNNKGGHSMHRSGSFPMGKGDEYFWLLGWGGGEIKWDQDLFSKFTLRI